MAPELVRRLPTTGAMASNTTSSHHDDHRNRARAADEAARTRAAQQQQAQEEDYEAWSKDALYARAKELGIPGRSEMNKAQLIDALRAF